jgi:hypothetical protein
MAIVKKELALVALLTSGMLGAGSLQASTLTYNLVYSNNAAGHISGDPWSVTNDIPNDGTTYATVTIDDEGLVSDGGGGFISDGLINFEVATGAYWDGKEDDGFGIQSFGFNLGGVATELEAADVDTSTLPSNWGATVNLGGINQDGLGGFDVTVNKTGTGQPNRQDPLVFSIDLGGDQSVTDDIFDYIHNSIPGANGSFLFAVHIAGFLDQNPLDPIDGVDCSGDAGATEGCNVLTSAWFGTEPGTIPPSEIPVPAAIWLFGSGLLGLVGIARRRKSS